MVFQKLYFSEKKGSKNCTISRYERTIQDNTSKKNFALFQGSTNRGSTNQGITVFEILLFLF